MSRIVKIIIGTLVAVLLIVIQDPQGYLSAVNYFIILFLFSIFVLSLFIQISKYIKYIVPALFVSIPISVIYSNTHTNYPSVTEDLFWTVFFFFYSLFFIYFFNREWK
jgi:hypothetical protein